VVYGDIVVKEYKTCAGGFFNGNIIEQFSAAYSIYCLIGRAAEYDSTGAVL
jgi:hypothetical protein